MTDECFSVLNLLIEHEHGYGSLKLTRYWKLFRLKDGYRAHLLRDRKKMGDTKSLILCFYVLAFEQLNLA